jgi:integrase
MHPAPLCTPTPTLAAYAEQWLEAIRGTVREQSRSRYAYRLTRYVLPSLGAIPLAELRRHDVRQCLTVLTHALAPHTVRGAHAVLHILLNAAIDDELIATNVAARLARKLHHAQRPKPVLDVRQLDLFLDTVRTEAPGEYPLFVAMAAGGLRVGEAIGLRAGDLSPTEPIVAVRRTVLSGGIVGPTKSGTPRHVRMTVTAAAILRAVQPGASGWLFPARKGPKPISYTYVKKITRKVAKLAGLPPISPKTFRRSYGHVLTEAGASLAWLRDQYGHSDEKTTARYYTDGAKPPVPDIFGK